MSCTSVTHIANSHASLPTLPHTSSAPARACARAPACAPACARATAHHSLLGRSGGVGNYVYTSGNEIYTLDEAAGGFAVILRAVVALALVCMQHNACKTMHRRCRLVVSKTMHR